MGVVVVSALRTRPMPAIPMSMSVAMPMAEEMNPDAKQQNQYKEPVFCQCFHGEISSLSIHKTNEPVRHYTYPFEALDVVFRPVDPSRGMNAGVTAAYRSYSAPSSARTSASSRLASPTYIQTSTGNITTVRIVGH